MINWFSFNALTILKDICILSVDANESFSRHVTVMQLVDMKHPVGVHVFDGVQVHKCTYALMCSSSIFQNFIFYFSSQALTNVANDVAITNVIIIIATTTIVY